MVFLTYTFVYTLLIVLLALGIRWIRQIKIINEMQVEQNKNIIFLLEKLNLISKD